MKHLPPILLALVFLSLAWWVWPKCPDAFVDFGREIYVAWRVSEGDLPGKDLDYFNGPLSPQVNGMIFRVFPATVRTLKVANLVVAAGCTAMLFLLLRRISDDWTAAGCGMVFCIASAMSMLGYEPYFSLVAPYSHEMSHGLALLLAILLLLEQPKRWRVWAAGICMGLAALTKPEILLACLAAAVTHGLLRRWLDRRIDWSRLMIFLSGAAIPLVICYLLLLPRVGAKGAAWIMAGTWQYLGNQELISGPYYQSLRGTDRLGENLQLTLVWLAGWITLAGGITVLARRFPHRLFAVIAAIIFAALFWLSASRIDWFDFSRPLIFMLIACALLVLPTILRRRDAAAQLILPLSCVAAFGALVMKVVLAARLTHYGFVLVVPGALLVIAIFCGPIMRRFGAPTGTARIPVLALLGCLTIWLIGKNHAAMEWRLVKLPVDDANRFDVDLIRGAPLAELIRDLQSTKTPNRTLAAVPVGGMINFLLKERNPTGHVTILPLDLLMFGDVETLAEFQRHPPDLIVLMHVDAGAHGARYFGRDFARELGAWIRENYVPVKQYGATPFTSDQFGILLLRRRTG